LSKKVDIKEYLISKEFHKVKGIHIHVFLVLNKRCDIKNCNYLNLIANDTDDVNDQGNLKEYHGNFQTGINKAALITYILKKDVNDVTGNEKEYISNMKFDTFNGEFVEPEVFVYHESKRLGIQLALKNYQERYPERAVKKLSNLLHNLETAERIRESVNEDCSSNTTDLSHFNLELLEDRGMLVKWINAVDKKTLILFGPKSTGKSFLGKTLMKKFAPNHLRISHYEGLKRLNAKHQGILIDDAKLSDLPIPNMISLLDTLDKNDLRILNNSKTKKEKLIQIITINNPNDIFPKLPGQLSKRVLLVHVPTSIVNINITNNYFYLNDKEDEEHNRKHWENIKNNVYKLKPEA
jgi:hypothetical protein